jgi:CRP-like cAMP-binding protein
MEDLDFSNPGGPLKSARPPQVPVYVPAIAETDCSLLAVSRPVFLNLVRSEPMFGISLLASMAERVRNTAAGIS